MATFWRIARVVLAFGAFALALVLGSVVAAALRVQLPFGFRIGVPSALGGLCALSVSRSRQPGESWGEKLGLPLHRAPQLSKGFVGGASLICAVMALLWLLHAYAVQGRSDADPQFLSSFVGFFLVAFGEEAVFRGVLFRAVEQWRGTALALAVTSVLFGAAHLFNPNASPFIAVAIAVEAGLLLGSAYVATRALWLPIGVHWAWNLFLGSVFSVPVSGQLLPGLLSARLGEPVLWSGGAFGPEGGLAALLLCSTAGVALLFLARRRGLWIPFSRG